ncbi:hypothetical protein J41TS12_17580 [Paenibacillus antibioticophila]|uniref:Uncharacterized protein n=1 Tax=Paenibacillus antibioticophila TaxID=1274374 RepID=A0A920CHL6_9BACL|nr:hypothetical protein [Paenibacillus antibioticophila]GIO36897.1 hypothetical protein J41TS12_17580 [Paenibacillus antibioticophila]
MARKTTQAEIRTSILDMRRIYAEKTDEQFAHWYQRRYRVPANSVLQVIQEKKAK